MSSQWSHKGLRYQFFRTTAQLQIHVFGSPFSTGRCQWNLAYIQRRGSLTWIVILSVYGADTIETETDIDKLESEILTLKGEMTIRQLERSLKAVNYL